MKYYYSFKLREDGSIRGSSIYVDNGQYIIEYHGNNPLSEHYEIIKVIKLDIGYVIFEVSEEQSMYLLNSSYNGEEAKQFIVNNYPEVFL